MSCFDRTVRLRLALLDKGALFSKSSEFEKNMCGPEVTEEENVNVIGGVNLEDVEVVGLKGYDAFALCASISTSVALPKYLEVADLISLTFDTIKSKEEDDDVSCSRDDGETADVDTSE